MRVLHISSSESWRGGEQQIVNLIEGLARKGVGNILLCPKDSPLASYQFPESIPVRTYPKTFLSNFSIPISLKSTIRRQQVQIVHAHDSHSHTYLWLAYILGLVDVPGVVHRRVDFRPSAFSIKKYSHPGIRKIICISDAILQILKAYGIPKSSLSRIYSGVEATSRLSEKKGFLRNKFHISGDQRIVANIAAMAPHKDYFTFVDVAEHVIRNAKLPVKFLIIGANGGEEDKIGHYIHRKQLHNDIHLTGFLQNAKSCLGELDCLLVTSKSEGLNTTILDAFAVGTPVVSTEAGGIPEIVVNGKTGLTALPGDVSGLAQAVVKIISDKDLANKLREQAKKFVQDFSIDRMSESVFGEYEKILSEIQ